MMEKHLLESWMIEHDVSRAEMARRMKMSESFLSQVLSGKRWLSLSKAVRAETITGGVVTAVKLARPEAAE